MLNHHPWIPPLFPSPVFPRESCPPLLLQQQQQQPPERTPPGLVKPKTKLRTGILVVRRVAVAPLSLPPLIMFPLAMSIRLLVTCLNMAVLSVMDSGVALTTMQLHRARVRLITLPTRLEPSKTSVPVGCPLVGTTRRPGP